MPSNMPDGATPEQYDEWCMAHSSEPDDFGRDEGYSNAAKRRMDRQKEPLTDSLLCAPPMPDTLSNDPLELRVQLERLKKHFAAQEKEAKDRIAVVNERIRQTFRNVGIRSAQTIGGVTVHEHSSVTACRTDGTTSEQVVQALLDADATELLMMSSRTIAALVREKRDAWEQDRKIPYDGDLVKLLPEAIRPFVNVDTKTDIRVRGS
jgi:hypothetical protein